MGGRPYTRSVAFSTRRLQTSENHLGLNNKDLNIIPLDSFPEGVREIYPSDRSSAKGNYVYLYRLHLLEPKRAAEGQVCEDGENSYYLSVPEKPQSSRKIILSKYNTLIDAIEKKNRIKQ